MLTTYGVLLREAELLSQFPWQQVILDEAQAINNYRSQSAQAAHELKGEYRIALSATPLKSNASELVSLFHFLNPGLLGTSTENTLLQPTIHPDDLALVSRSVRP